MPSKPARRFDVRAFLDSGDVETASRSYRRWQRVFSQGDAGRTVLYIQSGGVKLSVRSKAGKEVAVAMLGPGDFFGEGCMAGQPRRIGSATAVRLSTIVALEKAEMLRLLHRQPAVADRFITHLLTTNSRIEGALVDTLFNHDEKRLARTLLLLARYGRQDRPEPVLPRVSRAKLAKLVGLSRGALDVSLKKFERMGLVEPGRNLKVDHSLLSVVLYK